jgi:hypothetical protein
MTRENNILRENIEHFRHLITEAVSESDIEKYINNHEYVYIYYDGDDKTQSGSRTIRPYVLGTSKKSGKPVLRAWQDRGKSWHFQNKPTRPADDPNMQASKFHDYWIDEEGSKPGWRMFRLDKISKMYPTGKKFHDENGNVKIPAGYHEGGDDDMASIKAYVSTKTEPDIDVKYDRERAVEPVSTTDKMKQKWDAIRKGYTRNYNVTSEDIVKLRDIASRVYKKGHGNFLVAIDSGNNLHLITPEQKQKQNIPDTAVYGSLPYLYDSLVNASKTPDDRFFKNKLSQAQQQMNEENPTIPYKKMTFFK